MLKTILKEAAIVAGWTVVNIVLYVAAVGCVFKTKPCREAWKQTFIGTGNVTMVGRCESVISGFNIWFSAVYGMAFLGFAVTTLFFWYVERYKKPESLYRKKILHEKYTMLLDANLVWNITKVWLLYQPTIMIMHACFATYMRLPFAFNIFRFILTHFVMAYLSEFNLYYLHRFLHWRPIYFRLHHFHHSNYYANATSTLYVHPVEHLLTACTHQFLLVQCRADIFTNMFHMYLMYYNSVIAHSGFEIEGKPFVRHHLIHHLKPMKNFAFAKHMDRFHGTLSEDFPPGVLNDDHQEDDFNH